MHGSPACVLSPWIDRKISVITISLTAPARRLSALVTLDENYRGNGHQSGHHKSKRFQFVAQPTKDEEVPECDSNPGDDHDEEGAIHSNGKQ
jgi:hypothetical protein